MTRAHQDPPSGGAALELLVHGVGGTTPHEMLGDPRITRVTGDVTAAVYRRTEDLGAEQDPERRGDGPVPEAYCWSNLTSGNGSRALWLLLLPFMVVNLAHWMRPGARGSGTAVRLYGVMVRLIALSLTVLLTAAVCEVALDLVAWQCAGATECVGRRSWLGFLSPDQGGWWSQPGRRLALAALLPAALVGLLWYLSNRTWSAYESQRPLDLEESDNPPAPAAVPEPPGAPGVRPALGRPGFWYGRRLVARLRAAHTAAGFLTVAAAVGGAAARYDRSADGPVPAPVGRLFEVALVLCSIAVVGVVCRRGRSERRLDNRIDRAVTSFLPATALALLFLAAVYAAWSRPRWVSSGALPGEAVFGVLVLGQGLLVVVLAGVALGLYRRAPEPRTTLRGLGGPAVAMLACALGGVMTGGVAQRVADWLDGPGTPGMGGPSVVEGPPVLLSWQASVIPVLLLLLVFPVTWLVVRTARRARRMGPGIEAEYAQAHPDPGRTRQIARIRATAALTDSAPRIVALVSGATLFLGAGAVVGSWVSGQVPGRALDEAGPLVESVAEAAQATGSWLIGVGFILFVTWGRRAYRDVSARRTIGILWDVGTFWPRAAHPFAPPCYAERAVPDLSSRMCAWTGSTRGRLVISGHSQGSVLAAAAVWQLPAAARRQVALLTYGSPIERLYGRWFPAYFGPGALQGLHRSVHCWRNLWRATDPIGGPVRIDEGDGPEVDRGPLKDPLVYGRTVAHPLPEPVLGHSDYQADPSFAVERAALLDRLGPALPRQATGKVQGSSGRSSG
ncbi:hypothetical protein [Streptomyces sp. DpondAA-A50]|nr:putative integral membrane protein [Streptomyces sp. SirexAA-E]MYS02148.1 hypothetical protein [Streptomyces sp. SID4940]MYT66435.1 hypothetical protein [Streptomyces sp. SID8357]MYT83356.1 hypothetical protein [Streptomyces sp. SID8360]MYW35912.1 hypothetical protein [Streptomyces sp. SID1]PZX42763.1 hypothetical protein K373_01253 [Streptomyces sp. DvalAA-21]RAJ39206.1 hypothetical protein K351_00847 [Streptomyces sp. DpondAA-E10]RAJ53167.1 hypothetical protein K352_00243 [Streptomyces 